MFLETFGFAYPKDSIAEWTLVVAPCTYFLAYFWLIMSWRVAFSFPCFTAPIANPFTFSFPNTSWSNCHCWAEYIVISIVPFSPATISFLDSVMITWWRTPLNLIFFTDLFPKSAHKASSTKSRRRHNTNKRKREQTVKSIVADGRRYSYNKSKPVSKLLNKKPQSVRTTIQKTEIGQCFEHLQHSTRWK